MVTFINRSHEPDWRVREWFEFARALPDARTIVALPDTCPGRSPLPTGTSLLTKAADWRRLAVSDVGCGICIVRSSLRESDAASRAFTDQWRSLCSLLRTCRNRGLGDLGSGNHFLDAVVSWHDGSVCFVVHTGSRQESGLVDGLIESPARFDVEFRRIARWAADNRAAVLDHVEREFGRFVPMNESIQRLDRNHNHFEETDEGVIIRKGSQRVVPGELALIPSNLLDDMVLVRAGAGTAGVLNSLPHGTGRAMSRSDAKAAAHPEALAQLRTRVFIPECITDASLRTETPACYRSLESCLEKVADLCEEVERFTPVAYIGQL